MQTHWFRSALVFSIGAAVALGPELVAAQETVSVSDVPSLEAAFASARPGQTIVLSAGTYRLNGALRTGTDGAPDAPITVTAAQLGDAVILVDNVEGIVIEHADWVVQRVHVDGVCPGEDCDAGVHIKFQAHRFVLRDSRVSNFTQHIKGSRTPDDEAEDVQLLGNELYNDALRPNGSSPIDIVGGLRWRIAHNYIHDYGGDPNGDYGIFVKGGGADAIIERNLVVCAWDQPAGGATVGISFGGGGTGDQFCPDQDCSCEHHRGVARNNIVAHCTDAGLHTKRACGSAFVHNTVYDTGLGLQIQIDGAGDPVRIDNNVFSHRIVGGENRSEGFNLVDQPADDFRDWYADPDGLDFANGPSAGQLVQCDRLDTAPADYCAAERAGRSPCGAVEIGACATWSWGGRPDDEPGPEPNADVGPDVADPGPDTPDTGPEPEIDSGQPDSGDARGSIDAGDASDAPLAGRAPPGGGGSNSSCAIGRLWSPWALLRRRR